MKKTLTATLLCMAASQAVAGQPAAISVGDAPEFTYHARYLLEGKTAHSLMLDWPCDSDTARYALIAEIEPIAHADPLFPVKVRYTISGKRPDGIWLVDRGEFDCRFGAGANTEFSLVLRRTDSGAAVSLGPDAAGTRIAVPFGGDTIRTEALAGASLKRHSLIIRPAAAREKAPFPDTDSLMRRIAASADPLEAVWEYLDRDISVSEAALGGKYTIATVRTHGGYDIVYIDGADNTVFKWRPLDIKGRLADTAFEGHYDLEWLTDARYSADSEANATIGAGMEIIELNFPSLHSRLRFRRRHL